MRPAVEDEAGRVEGGLSRMKLRVLSDGTSSGTYVLDEKNNVIDDVTAVTWTCSAGKQATVTLTLVGTQVDVTGEKAEAPKPDVVEVICPACRVRVYLAATDVKAEDKNPGTENKWKCATCQEWNPSHKWFDMSLVV